jgi:hypothetical protein
MYMVVKQSIKLKGGELWNQEVYLSMTRTSLMHLCGITKKVSCKLLQDTDASLTRGASCATTGGYIVFTAAATAMREAIT